MAWLLKILMKLEEKSEKQKCRIRRRNISIGGFCVKKNIRGHIYIAGADCLKSDIKNDKQYWKIGATSCLVNRFIMAPNSYRSENCFPKRAWLWIDNMYGVEREINKEINRAIGDGRKFYKVPLSIKDKFGDGKTELVSAKFADVVSLIEGIVKKKSNFSFSYDDWPAFNALKCSGDPVENANIAAAALRLLDRMMRSDERRTLTARAA